MALTHALSTNNYGNPKFIVATSAANGTHTTLATAMADAVSGDTIAMRDSVTENVTLTAGVNIVAWNGETLNTPTITGTLTMTAAGTCNVSGIRLVTNSAAIIAVTGSAASVLNLNNCFLNCSNNTGITFSSSDAGARINIKDCRGDIGTTGIAIFTHTSAGALNFNYTTFGNTGGSSTASTASAGTLLLRFCQFSNPITTSGTAGVVIASSLCDTSVQNVAALTCGGSGGNLGLSSYFASGSASAISIGATLTMTLCAVNSTNTNAITGAGTIVNAGVSFIGSSSKINTSTQTVANIDVGGISFDGGTNNLQNYATGTYTPTMVGVVAGVTTYTSQLGFYTRIGNVVYAQAQVTGSAATGTGDINYGALPFTIKNQAGGVPLGELDFVQARTWPAGRTYIAVSGTVNTIVLTATAAGSAVAGANVQMANVAFTDFYSIVYQT